MQLLKVLLFLPLSIHLTLSSTLNLTPRSELNGPCTGAGGAPGVCISITNCDDGGGQTIIDACPGTPDNIRCCTKTTCGTGNKGNCRFTSSCASGITETNKCPGPANFKCCMPSGSSTPGSWPPPTFPSLSSGCKQIAIDGAKAIVAQFPGKTKEIGCIRKCDDPASSDHCTGMATDMMVANGGVSTYFLTEKVFLNMI